MIKKIITIVFTIYCFCCTNGGYCATEKVFLSEEEVLAEAQFSDEPEDVQKARYEAFKDVVYQIDPKTFEKYLKDKYFVAPPKEKGGKPKLKPRFGGVHYYSNDTYEVFLYAKFLQPGYIYSSKDGILKYLSILKTTDTEDCFIYLYGVNGKLQYIEYLTFEKTKSGFKNNGYVFDKNRKWTGTWKKSVLYSPDEKQQKLEFFDGRIFK